MARITDHPLRIARLRANLSQLELARRAGVQRSAITAIEDGRTKVPTQRIIDSLAEATHISADELMKNIKLWNERPIDPAVKPSTSNLMLIPPYLLGQYYKSFTSWRREIAPTPTALASMLRLNPAIVRDYESGKLKSMPDSLASRLISAFEKHGFSPDYLAALEGLPRS